MTWQRKIGTFEDVSWIIFNSFSKLSSKSGNVSFNNDDLSSFDTAWRTNLKIKIISFTITILKSWITFYQWQKEYQKWQFPWLHCPKICWLAVDCSSSSVLTLWEMTCLGVGFSNLLISFHSILPVWYNTLVLICPWWGVPLKYNSPIKIIKLGQQNTTVRLGGRRRGDIKILLQLYNLEM